MIFERKPLNGQSLLKLTEFLDTRSDWRYVRACLAKVGENNDILTEDERRLLLFRLPDFLFHTSCAVRLQAIETASILLSGGTGELWHSFLHQLLFPDWNLEEQQSRWLGYILMEIIRQTSKRLDETRRQLFLSQYLAYFKSVRWQKATCLNLLTSLLSLPPADISTIHKHDVFNFIRQYLSRDAGDIHTLSLLLLHTWQLQSWQPEDDEKRFLMHYTLPEDAPFVRKYLLRKLRTENESALPCLKAPSAAFLMRRNLHIDDDWTGKLGHLLILREYLQPLSDKDRHNILTRDSYAEHLQNILRLSDHPMVYLSAASILCSLIKELESQHIYELLQENLKEMELGSDPINFVPRLFSQGFFMLSENEQTDFIRHLNELSDSRHEETVKNACEVICLLYRQSALSGCPLPHSDLLAGILRRNLKDYRKNIVAETRFLLEHFLMSEDLSIHDEALCRLLSENAADSKVPADNSNLSERASDLSLSEPLSPDAGRDTGNSLKDIKKIAFFSAIFDPFSSRDLAIVEEILNRGFTVCLAIRDYSADINPQPSRIRRKMLELSIAGLENVMILPENIAINTSSSKGLDALRLLFPEREIYLVTSGTELSDIHPEINGSWPRIIYSDYETQALIDREAVRQIISGDIIFMQLPVRFQGISSDEIRRKVFQHKDITGMVDNRVQELIRRWRLYLDRPMYRKEVTMRPLERYYEKDRIRVRGSSGSGCLSWHFSGRTVLIRDISGDVVEGVDYRSLVITEFLAWCQAHDVSNAVCPDASAYGTLLEPFGFIPMDNFDDALSLDMKQAIVLFLDVSSLIKEPYQNEPRLLKVIQDGELRLCRALTHLYPGKPVLPLHTDIINYHLVNLLNSELNAGSPEAVDKLCVPFGKILKGIRIPGIKIKELNTEKVYNSELSSFEIREMPSYPTLNAQINALRSFECPVVLVDDLFHKGYRFEKISDLMENEGLRISHIYTSVLSGQGTDLAGEKNVSVDAVYKIKNMKTWVLESDLYPFVGGDGIDDRKPAASYGSAIPSINTILPHQMPTFFRGASSRSVYELSEICLENARRLYVCLEGLYFEEHHKPLTLERIGEVMAEPRFPSDIDPRANRSVRLSELIAGIQQRLKRLRYI